MLLSHRRSSDRRVGESRKHLKIRDQRCARPRCDIPTTAGSEFFVERLIGRQPQVDGDEEAHPLQYNYLVKWEGSVYSALRKYIGH